MTKPTKWHVGPAKTQISLGICPVWSVFAIRMKKYWPINYLLSASKKSDQTGRMPRLIWVFAGRTCQFVGFVTRRLGCFVLILTWSTEEWTKVLFSGVLSRGTKPDILVSSSNSTATHAEIYTSFLHADSEDSDQTGRMPRLIWVFAGRTCHFVGFVTMWPNYELCLWDCVTR